MWSCVECMQLSAFFFINVKSTEEKCYYTIVYMYIYQDRYITKTEITTKNDNVQLRLYSQKTGSKIITGTISISMKFLHLIVKSGTHCKEIC